MTGSILRFAILCKEKELIQAARPTSPFQPQLYQLDQSYSQTIMKSECVLSVKLPTNQWRTQVSARIRGLQSIDPSLEYRTGRVHDLRYGFGFLFELPRDLSIPPTFGRIRSSLPCLPSLLPAVQAQPEFEVCAGTYSFAGQQTIRA